MNEANSLRMSQPVRKLVFKLLKFLLQRRFPAVQWVTGEQLQQWMQSGTPPVKLLDARSPAEYAVSYLPNAELAGELIRPEQPPRMTVVYCAVGYRSARVAHQLQLAGLTQVLNLEGGIFQWANEGRPLLHQEQVTQQVHAYDLLWGWLLHAPHRAWS